MKIKEGLILVFLAGNCILSAGGDVKVAIDAEKVLQEARTWNAEKAEQIEVYLKNTPDDPLQRSILAAYYFATVHKDQSLRLKKNQNILWMIEHYPQLAILRDPAFRINPLLEGEENYRKGCELWDTHLKKNPSNAVIIANAASYFLDSEREKAERYYLKARELAPKNSLYAWNLVSLYFQPAGVLEGIETESAKKALKHYKDAYQLSDLTTRSRYLPTVVKAAWYAEDFKQLEIFAADMKKMLESDPKGNQGNLIFWTNTAYGLLAVHKGDYKEAADYLLKSAETPGSSKLNSFGPNMLLARAVLEHGDKESVLKFFAQCERFWKIGKKQMGRWVKDMQLGDMPNFGAHLYY